MEIVNLQKYIAGLPRDRASGKDVNPAKILLFSV